MTVKILRFIIGFLPRLIRAYERLCIRIASEGFHKPGFYLSTLCMAPIGLWLWRRPVPSRWKRIPCRLAALPFSALSFFFFLKGTWVFALLLLPGRLVRRLWRRLGFDQSQPFAPVPSRLGFSITRVDRAVLILMGAILMVFFVNRSQLMPKDDSDHNYHMAVARQILEQGRIPTWDDWEYAPAGRPHLYPPALHLLIAICAGNPEKIPQGFETLQVVVYPLSLLFTWWFARWLFGPSIGFLTALVFSMDMIAGLTMISVLPSALVTGLMPLLFMTFLTRRRRSTVALLTFFLYTHIGMSTLLILGLFLFSARYRGYYDFFKQSFTRAFILYLPWFLHILDSLDWLGTPGTQVFAHGGRSAQAMVSAAIAGVLSLQFINPLFLILGLIGLRRYNHPAAVFLRRLLFGFLPMLIFYGGRFWMHTGPLWAIFISSVISRWVPFAPSRRRVFALMLLILIPLPLIALGFKDRGFALLPNVGGATFAIGYVLIPEKDDPDFEQLADFIRRQTTGREIVHVAPERQYLGDRIVTATGRRVDVGGWSAEVRNPKMAQTVEDYRQADTDCLFVCETAPLPSDLRCDRVETFGRFKVGIRGKSLPLDRQQHPPEPPRPVKMTISDPSTGR